MAGRGRRGRGLRESAFILPCASCITDVPEARCTGTSRWLRPAPSMRRRRILPSSSRKTKDKRFALTLPPLIIKMALLEDSMTEVDFLTGDFQSHI
eukprot:s13693_g1.t1